jgi:hypothetical protein
MTGLLDVETLSYDGKKEHSKQKLEPSSSPQGAAKEPVVTADKISQSLDEIRSVLVADADDDENALLPNKNNGASYRSGIAAKSR